MRNMLVIVALFVAFVSTPAQAKPPKAESYRVVLPESGKKVEVQVMDTNFDKPDSRVHPVCTKSAGQSVCTFRLHRAEGQQVHLTIFLDGKRFCQEVSATRDGQEIYDTVEITAFGEGAAKTCEHYLSAKNNAVRD